MPRLSIGATGLRAWRDEVAKLTQTTAANAVGIDPTYYAKIERGARKPGRAVAVAIERATGGAVGVADWDRYVNLDDASKHAS